MFRNVYSLFALFSLTSAINYVPLYSPEDNVIELTPENFDKMVLKGKSTWLVQFYAPWCTYCKTFIPEYKKAAKSLKGSVKVGAVNAYEHKALANRYDIKGYPTVKIFTGNKRSPISYNGKRKATDIVQACMFTLHGGA